MSSDTISQMPAPIKMIYESPMSSRNDSLFMAFSVKCHYLGYRNQIARHRIFYTFFIFAKMLTKVRVHLS